MLILSEEVFTSYIAYTFRRSFYIIYCLYFRKFLHHILLILSGDIGLNPGLVYNSQLSCSNEWNVLKVKESHLIHLNVNNLLPKINETQYIPARTNTAVMEISKSKLNEAVLQSEIQISNYGLLGYDRRIETVEVSLATLKVINVKTLFFRRKSKIFCLKLNL